MNSGVGIKRVFFMMNKRVSIHLVWSKNKWDLLAEFNFFIHGDFFSLIQLLQNIFKKKAYLVLWIICWSTWTNILKKMLPREFEDSTVDSCCNNILVSLGIFFSLLSLRNTINHTFTTLPLVLLPTSCRAYL